MRVSFTLSPKPAKEYTLEQLERIYTTWGSYSRAAAAINVSDYSFKKAIKHLRNTNKQP